VRLKVIASKRDPSNLKKRLFTLECGHEVSREGASDKQWAVCGYCQQRRYA
jgi:transcription elongation factor Elf1